MIRFDIKFYEFVSLLSWFVDKTRPDQLSPEGKRLVAEGITIVLLFLHSVGCASTVGEAEEVFYNCLVESFVGTSRN